MTTQKEITVEYQNVKKDDRVFNEFDKGDAAFVVILGRIEVFKTINDKDVIIGTVGEGGMFGEMALIDNRRRLASARAVDGDARLMVITRDLFNQRLSNLAPFQRALIKVLSDHVRSVVDTLSTEIKAS